jgi:preprotein translocase subunit YajC
VVTEQAVGDTVTISGVHGAIGGISAARLNVEMTIASVSNTQATFTADIGGCQCQW